MNHQARFMAHLREQQAKLLEEIELFSSGQARRQLLRDGVFIDATEPFLVALYRELGHVGALIQEASAPPDL